MCPRGRRTVEPDDSLAADLGYDSLALVELSLELESRFGFEAMDDGETFDIVTVRDVEELVEKLSLGAADPG